ncbi:hypothetical protein [Thermus thermamylovorans]|uniref:Uncharacterized protein n=1 Tax=Thermus thermamylovorans TaxID=2509362 RepID=A0A4Q9AZU3_9DEIN|nr:hypothetical protein [Thermus thermamylovorans]TBH17487.1 hypothetical protein ETP66_08855 [Thermus thermamylovorans]
MRLALWTLLLLPLAACNLQGPPPVRDGLAVGERRLVDLEAARVGAGDRVSPSVRVYWLRLEEDGAVRVGAVSQGLGLQARLRLLLLDERGVVQAVSVAPHWFAAEPGVAPLGLAPQIATSPADPGVRLNLRGQAGQVFQLRVENYAPRADRVRLYAQAFTPNPAGQGEAFTAGSRTGAIEFARQFDRYDVSQASGYLRLAYAGPLDLVALLYRGPGDPAPRALDPLRNCAPVDGATLLVVRDRALVRAGFDEEGSGRYTLSLSATPCP